LTFDSIEIPVYNSKIYMAGKHTWSPISINLRDDATAQVQRLVGEQLQKQFDFYEQSSAAAGIDDADADGAPPTEQKQTGGR
jgi:hypothetical protein